MSAAAALYNMERGIRPVVFGGSDAKEKAKARKKIKPMVFFPFVAIFLLLFVHFSGVLKSRVTGRVLASEGPFACDIRFHSGGTSSSCSTDAAGRFNTKLYPGTYRVVVEKRPGLPKAYQSLSTTPLRVRAKDGLVLRIVD